MFLIYPPRFWFSLCLSLSVCLPLSFSPSLPPLVPCSHEACCVSPRSLGLLKDLAEYPMMSTSTMLMMSFIERMKPDSAADNPNLR